RQKRPDLAVDSLQKSIELNANSVQAHAMLGTVYRHLGKLDEAIAASQKAIELKSDFVQAHNNLATALHSARRWDDAAAAFEQALRLNPDDVSTLNNYANLLAEIDKPAKATRYYRAALSADPSRIEILSNLGNVLKSQAKLSEAIACYKQTLALQPQRADIHSNLLMTMNCQPQADSGLLAEHQKWAERHAARHYPTSLSFTNDRSPDRRLRIGYVSPDFRRHSVAYFFEPILIAHDRAQFEIFCYSDVVHGDDVTQRLRDRADQWRDIAGLSDVRIAQLIRKDEIDILVDLAGHTAHNRLIAFAHRPAPIQVNYLGYPNTTGVATIDYRITDAQADPPGLTESQHTEKLVRLPSGFLCYRPAENSPPPRDVAQGENSFLTFGTCNNFAKVTPQMIALWSKILLAVPDSRLLIKAKSLGEESVQQEMHAAFANHGIDAQRLQLLTHEPSFLKHLTTYQQIDIALDTFPYHGTTTTCEALWMGVPVVTRAGNAHVSRVGVSLLHRVGLNELIAENDEQYVSIAIDLASDPQRRKNISSSLRDRMQSSPLTNAENFVRDMESIYRQMWQTWCRP
ncbi:MAG TPA: tetratricopeptide repeat protein, partial [Tepidisphaeraceae bacterium]|nr:tetratricopeptide repeat protein [Tepidisphaeraceae bacterium]